MTPTPEHAAMARERNDSGRYVETVAPDDVLGTFDAVDGPVITSTDVSEYLECTTEAARQKLKRLVDDGTLARRRTGRTFVYWRAAETTGDESAAHTAKEQSASQDDRDTTPDGERRDAGARAESDAENTAARIVDSCSYKRDLTPPRRRHLEAWIQHAADIDGGVQLSDFKTWWTDERAGETGYNPGSFWEAFAKATMKQSDRFTKPNNRTYRYTGEVDP